jgi:hypothetical protein
MKKSHKILLGLAAISPFVFAALFFGAFLELINTAPVTGFEEHFLQYAWIMNLSSSIFTLFYLGILVIYIVHAARNPNLEVSGMRTTWLIALCVCGGWAMPFYWFHHIWRDGAPKYKSGPLGLN